MAIEIKKIKKHLRKTMYIFAFVLLVFNKGVVAQEDTNIACSPLDTMKQEKLSKFYMRYDFTDHLHSVWLIELNEPSLDELGYESYRFTWHGSFGEYHNPLSVRIENHNGNIFLIAKYVQRTNYNRRKNKFKNVDLLIDTVYLEQKEWKIFKDKINDINFFDIPPIEITNVIIADGSAWIFEGNNDKFYHMVQRHVYPETSEIGDICLYLLKLSNIPIKEKWFY